jgi:molybdopterin-synthase adenylyltransferase
VYRRTFAEDYSRLEQTPFTHSRLQRLRCVVVGAGALGNEVARVLGLLGTANVTMVDPDVVEPTNVPRSIFFHGPKSVGLNKAIAVIEAAKSLFPETNWAAIAAEIAEVGFQKLADTDLLFSCVDSDLARLEIAYISTRLRVPMVDGGLGRQNYSHGRVTYFPGTKDQACYGCMLSPTKRRELLELWQAIVRSCSPENEAEELISTPTFAGMVGCMQVEVGLRSFFLGRERGVSPCRSLEIQIHPSRRMEDFSVPVRADCPFHHEEGSLRRLPRADSTFAELLASAGSGVLVLDWPVCVDAKCADCGKQWRPMMRLAALRRRGRCPGCGSRRMVELQTIRAIERDSVWSRQTPSALQLPADHLYSVHPASFTL